MSCDWKWTAFYRQLRLILKFNSHAGGANAQSHYGTPNSTINMYICIRVFTWTFLYTIPLLIPSPLIPPSLSLQWLWCPDVDLSSQRPQWAGAMAVWRNSKAIRSYTWLPHDERPTPAGTYIWNISYHKSENFLVKNMFVVDSSYENYV